MKRLFTFGCSFTNYRWSTWADALAPEFDYFENWGQSGGGNHYIFNSVMECDQRHRFGDGDTVMVCWTNFLRDDRYVNGKWVTLGGIGWTPIYTKEFIADAVDNRGLYIRDLAFIKAAKTLLESRPKVDWHFFSMCPINFADIFYQTPEPGTTDVTNLYQDVVNCIKPSFQTTIRPLGWCHHPSNNPGLGGDDHPTPSEHIEYLDKIFPGWITKQQTRDQFALETADLKKDPRKSGISAVTRL